MRAQLQQLAERIQAIATPAGVAGDGSPMLATGWPAIDEELGGGLARGAIHEWFGQEWGERSSLWFPPMAVLVHLARCAIEQQSESGKVVVWIGKRCWPNVRNFGFWISDFGLTHRAAIPHQSKIQNPKSTIDSFQIDSPLLLNHSLFIDPPDEASRVWAIDLALRSPAVAAVAADGAGLQMAHTRRLQLAAEAPGSRAIGLLARSPRELNVISAARTRWVVSAEGTKNKGMEAHRHEGTKEALVGELHSLPTSLRAFVPLDFDVSSPPRWRLDLLRCKGVRPAAARAIAQRSWVVEYDHAKNGLDLSADVADRPDPTAARLSVFGSRISA